MSSGLNGDPDYNGPTNKRLLCVGLYICTYVFFS